MKSFRIITLFVFCIVIFSACSPSVTPTPTQVPTSTPEPPTQIPFILTSSAFADGGDIIDKYVYSMVGQCSGENFSVPLSWSGAPEGTQSFTLIMSDPDGQNWGHWVQYDIPANVTELPEVVGGPDIGVKGNNDFNRLGYGGPCPPSGVHRYLFTLYAVDTILDLGQGAYDYELEIALEGHILAQAQLTGLRSAD